MPRALISKSARGSATLVVTATCAGQVEDGVGVGVAGEHVVHRLGVADVGLDEVGRRPCSRSQARLASAPRRLRLSTTTTRSPAAWNRAAAWQPMNPAPPVMTHFLMRDDPSDSTATSGPGRAGRRRRPRRLDRTPTPTRRPAGARSNRATAAARPASPSRPRRPASATSRPSAAASAAGSPGGQPRAVDAVLEQLGGPARPGTRPPPGRRPSPRRSPARTARAGCSRGPPRRAPGTPPAGSAWWPANPTRSPRPERPARAFSSSSEHLRPGRPVDRPADDIEPRRQARPASRATASRKTSCPFQRGEGRDQADADRPRGRRRAGRPRASSQAPSPGPGRNRSRSTRVVDRLGPGRDRPRTARGVVGHRPRDGHRRDARAGPSSRSSRAITGARAEVVVQVPDDRHAPRRGPGAEQVRLHPVGLDQVGPLGAEPRGGAGAGRPSAAERRRRPRAPPGRAAAAAPERSPASPSAGDAARASAGRRTATPRPLDRGAERAVVAEERP